MRTLDSASRRDVQTVIDAHQALWEALPSFVAAEPGFPVADGRVVREPAILVFVNHKRPPQELLAEDRLPRQLGPYRVAVMQADPWRQLEAQLALDGSGPGITAAASSLTYGGVEGDPIDIEYEIDGTLLCHLGPDAGWPVLKPYLEAARESLTVAMYDFNAAYIAKTFIDTVRNAEIAAMLTWDDSMTAPETDIRVQLRQKLKTRLDAAIIQCGSGRRFASAYHEKVVVRDHASFWLSSGNWSKRSQPNIDPVGDPATAKGMYATGNREWHLIVEDETLARLFEQYIVHDLTAAKADLAAGEQGVALDVSATWRLPDVLVPLELLQTDPALALAAPEPIAPLLLPSQPRRIKVRPLLTPDNYVGRIAEWLASARRSIYLQFSYITYSSKAGDEPFTELLETLAELSYKPGLDMRIIVGNNSAADKVRRLAEAGFNDAVFRVQSNVHNKGIIVDGSSVLVSSANWSGDGVLRNRDAGLIIHDREIAGYFRQAFLYDWDERANLILPEDSPVLIAPEDGSTPAGMVRMSWRDYFG
jgi:phosphatidylserine/phosphatidylglycerophosphate/cardiolipin synthase-like enzyme